MSAETQSLIDLGNELIAEGRIDRASLVLASAALLDKAGRDADETTPDDLAARLDAYDKAAPTQRPQAADDLANVVSDFLDARRLASGVKS